MKTIYKILIVIILIGLLYLIIKNNKDQYFKQIVLTDSNSVINVTNQTYMDTIVRVGLEQLNVNDCYITIKPMDPQVQKNFNDQTGLNLQACIVGSSDMYDIYVEDMDRTTSIAILSHELKHLQQYHDGRLTVIGHGVVLWEGKKINVLDIPYDQRLWEIEAFNQQNGLANSITKKLY